MKSIDYDRFMNEANRIMQKSFDESYEEGIRRAMSLVKRYTRPSRLEVMVKTAIFNSDGHMDPDRAARKVILSLPVEGLYDLLFGKEES